MISVVEDKPGARELIAQLVFLTRTWNEFDAVPVAQQETCREIGVQLNDIGGIELMREVYYIAKSKNRCVCVVQAYWDKIGEWRW